MLCAGDFGARALARPVRGGVGESGTAGDEPRARAHRRGGQHRLEAAHRDWASRAGE